MGLFVQYKSTVPVNAGWYGMRLKVHLKGLKWVIMGLPLGGVAFANFFPLVRSSQQFLILIVLIWIQVFFIFDFFAIGK